MHNFLWLISWWKFFSIPVISLTRNVFYSDKFILLISFIFKITQKYIIILFKVIGRKQTSKISQFFAGKLKINESNANAPTHYWIVCLYSKNVSFYVGIPEKFFKFFRSMFTTNAIEINTFTSAAK